jgi:hypothetical protein
LISANSGKIDAIDQGANHLRARVPAGFSLRHVWPGRVSQKGRIRT